MSELGNLLGGLKQSQEDGESLLERTMVMQGSNLGHANKHDNRNLPILLAGGGFKHVQHLAFDTKSNTPLANLYVTMLERLGIRSERFSTSSGNLKGLDLG